MIKKNILHLKTIDFTTPLPRNKDETDKQNFLDDIMWAIEIFCLRYGILKSTNVYVTL